MNQSVQHAASAHGLATFAHPLDPLGAAEIAQAVTAIRDHFAWGDDLRVETIDIDEPAKEVVRATGRATRSSELPASKSIAAA